MASICGEGTDKEHGLSWASPRDRSFCGTKSGEVLFLARGPQSFCPGGWQTWSLSALGHAHFGPKQSRLKSRKGVSEVGFRSTLPTASWTFKKSPTACSPDTRDCVPFATSFPQEAPETFMVLWKSAVNVMSVFFRKGNRISPRPLPLLISCLIVWLEDGVKGLMIQAPPTLCSRCRSQRKLRSASSLGQWLGQRMQWESSGGSDSPGTCGTICEPGLWAAALLKWDCFISKSPFCSVTWNSSLQ